MFKKFLCAALLCAFIAIPTAAVESKLDILACAAAEQMEGEPFVVKTAYCEMLLNRETDPRFPSTLTAVICSIRNGMTGYKKATSADCHAAATALNGSGIAGGALYAARWEDIKNTPLSMRSGVRLYDWFFYS